MHPLSALIVWNEVQKFASELSIVHFLGLARDAVAKDTICKFQEGRHYVLPSSAHHTLHCFLISYSHPLFSYLRHAFLSLGLYRIPPNPVLGGVQESFAHDSGLLRVCHP